MTGLKVGLEVSLSSNFFLKFQPSLYIFKHGLQQQIQYLTSKTRFYKQPAARGNPLGNYIFFKKYDLNKNIDLNKNLDFLLIFENTNF